LSTQRVLGIVTEERGSFICKSCQHEIEMVAIIDIRNPRARIWKEAEPHTCAPLERRPNPN